MKEKAYAVEIKNLNLKIKKEHLLKDINVSFEYGKIYGIIGRNGSGKTL
ncbi:MAG: ATP-binding cassette domain-containing protein, partial [Brotaphodocola sp.]